MRRCVLVCIGERWQCGRAEYNFSEVTAHVFCHVYFYSCQCGACGDRWLADVMLSLNVCW